MIPWAPEDNRISILLSCALDFNSWKGEAGQDEAIEEILEGPVSTALCLMSSESGAFFRKRV